MTYLPGGFQEPCADVQDEIEDGQGVGYDAVEHEDEADTGLPADDHPGETALMERIPRRLSVPESRPRYPRPVDVLLRNVPCHVSSLEIGSLEDVAATCVASRYAVGTGNGIAV